MSNIGVIVYQAGDLRVEDVGEPTPATDEAIVEIAYGGICGSDLHYWKDGAAGTSILREPMILGHEVSGIVAAVAADGSGPAAGTRVTVHPLTPRNDGATPWPQDRPNLAPAATYLGSALYLPHTQGAFASRVAIATRMLHKIPDTLPLRRAALTEPASVAWHAVGRAGDIRGKRVGVIGSGPIGLLATATALHHGAKEVTATDVCALPRQIAEGLGAHTLDARDNDTIATLNADVVIESSGTVPGLAAAISACIRGGIVVMVGLQRAGSVEAPIATAITRELTLRGSFRFTNEIDDVIDALATDALNVHGIITATQPAQEALEAFRLAADAASSAKVMLSFTEGSEA